jgi:hypothetical protein
MGRVRRFSVSTSVLALALAVPGAASAADLLPDLRTEPPESVQLVHHETSDRTVLRFSNTVSDHGAGPLEIYPDPAYADCDGDGTADDHTALQRVYRDRNHDGVFERGVDTRHTDSVAGCKVFHEAHGHWHFAGFARYTLRSIRTDRRRSTPKVSFCMLDGELVYQGLPGSPPGGFYDPACGEFDVQGLSVGWADTYGAGLPGQRINVTGLARGRYCLSSVADPENRLQESDDANNSDRLLLELHPGKLFVRELAEGCAGV